MNTGTDTTPGPTVKLTPEFKKGQIIYCKSSGEPFKILKVHDNGLQCAGRAGLMPKKAALTEKPAEPVED